MRVESVICGLVRCARREETEKEREERGETTEKEEETTEERQKKTYTQISSGVLGNSRVTAPRPPLCYENVSMPLL